MEAATQQRARANLTKARETIAKKRVARETKRVITLTGDAAPAGAASPP